MQAIRGLVPVKSILKNLVNHDDAKDDAKDDSDEDNDDVQVKKPIVSLQPATATATATEPAATEIVEEKQSESVLPIIEPISLAVDALSSLLPSSDTKNNSTESAPTIINLDEKPSVSFATFNSLFSDNPDSTDMINANDNTPDLEIADEPSSALSGDDFDSLDGPSDESLPLDDYEEL